MRPVRSAGSGMTRDEYVNMTLEVVDKSGLFKWLIYEEDEGAIGIAYSDWDEKTKAWKKPNGELVIYGTDRCREIAKRIVQLCDHIDSEGEAPVSWAETVSTQLGEFRELLEGLAVVAK